MPVNAFLSDHGHLMDQVLFDRGLMVAHRAFLMLPADAKISQTDPRAQVAYSFKSKTAPLLNVLRLNSQA
jgi:hypothetical protein